MIAETEKIINYYPSENTGVKANLRRMLNSFDLKGSGKLIILAVDQGMEHGPDASFSDNSFSYSPFYHHALAIAYGYNAYAAPLGALKHSAELSGMIPTILKINCANSLFPAAMQPNQSVSATIESALQLGCSAIGFTIYPGSQNMHSLINQFTPMAEKASSYGLAVVVWSYARGDALNKEEETALDVINYCAHIAAQLGAHIIKVKIPSSTLKNASFKNKLGVGTEFFREKIKDIIQKYDTRNFKNDIISTSKNINEVTRACFNNDRIVIFSGGAKKNDEQLLLETMAIKLGGGYGSIIGRNIFQRNPHEAAHISQLMKNIYNSKDESPDYGEINNDNSQKMVTNLNSLLKFFNKDRKF